MSTVQIETHCHTDESSECGRVPARRIVRDYKEKGSGAVIVTDHYNAGRWDKPHLTTWEKCMDAYLLGYHIACEEGSRCGMKILQGIEILFDGYAPHEFLVYGPDEAFLRTHPRLNEMLPSAFFQMAKELGFLVFHAHPFRFSPNPLLPAQYDGVEIYNGHPRHNSHNRKAAQFAFENGLLWISGSDYHRLGDCGRGGIILPQEEVSIPGMLAHYREKGSPELIMTFESELPAEIN